MTRRGEQARGNEQANRRDPVGVKIPVPDRHRRARMITEHRRIERKADEHDAEQNNSSDAQPRMRHTAKQPAKRRAFQRPAQRDPLSIKGDRKDQRDKE